VAFYDPTTLEGFILQRADWIREQQREARRHRMTTDSTLNDSLRQSTMRTLSAYNFDFYRDKLIMNLTLRDVEEYLASATIYATWNFQTDREAFQSRITKQLQEVMPGNYEIRLREYEDGKLCMDMEFATAQDETFFLLKYAWQHYFSWSYPWLFWPWPAQLWLGAKDYPGGR
jgi:hypothetical protein